MKLLHTPVADSIVKELLRRSQPVTDVLLDGRTPQQAVAVLYGLYRNDQLPNLNTLRRVSHEEFVITCLVGLKLRGADLGKESGQLPDLAAIDEEQRSNGLSAAWSSLQLPWYAEAIGARHAAVFRLAHQEGVSLGELAWWICFQQSQLPPLQSSWDRRVDEVCGVVAELSGDGDCSQVAKWVEYLPTVCYDAARSALSPLSIDTSASFVSTPASRFSLLALHALKHEAALLADDSELAAAWSALRVRAEGLKALLSPQHARHEAQTVLVIAELLLLVTTPKEGGGALVDCELVRTAVGPAMAVLAEEAEAPCPVFVSLKLGLVKLAQQLIQAGALVDVTAAVGSACCTNNVVRPRLLPLLWDAVTRPTAAYGAEKAMRVVLEAAAIAAVRSHNVSALRDIVNVMPLSMPTAIKLLNALCNRVRFASRWPMEETRVCDDQGQQRAV
jgi:hypothetical protein